MTAKGNDKFVISYTKVPGAAGYDIFFGKGKKAAKVLWWQLKKALPLKNIASSC